MCANLQSKWEEMLGIPTST